MSCTTYGDEAEQSENASTAVTRSGADPEGLPTRLVPSQSHDQCPSGPQTHQMARPTPRRPSCPRSSTDPSLAVLLQGYSTSAAAAASKHQNSSHRNRSPFSRSHLRSRSSGSAVLPPAMIRAHSMPAVHTPSRSFESTPSASLSPASAINRSPQRSPARARSPLYADSQEPSAAAPRSPLWYEATGGIAIESIQEDSELDLTPRNSTVITLPTPPITTFTRSGSLRRRPASPLHNVTSAPTSLPISSTTEATDSGSPALPPTRYNETFPSNFSLHHYASTSSFSSISSTPSSARSRSPSISSLETIEDAPDAESEALEADRIMRLKLAAERSERTDSGEDSSDDGGRRKSLDTSRGFGFTRGRNAERKRWSICGGERRADLDLETIWED